MKGSTQIRCLTAEEIEGLREACKVMPINLAPRTKFVKVLSAKGFAFEEDPVESETSAPQFCLILLYL